MHAVRGSGRGDSLSSGLGHYLLKIDALETTGSLRLFEISIEKVLKFVRNVPRQEFYCVLLVFEIW